MTVCESEEGKPIVCSICGFEASPDTEILCEICWEERVIENEPAEGEEASAQE